MHTIVDDNSGEEGCGKCVDYDETEEKCSVTVVFPAQMLVAG